MKLGKDNVIMGNVPIDLEMGDGNVIIGPTDCHGNTTLNTPMAVGRGAHAGPDSIAIGAGANAGSAVTLGQAIQELIRIAESKQDDNTVDRLRRIDAELEQPTPDRSTVMRAWDGVKAAASISGAHSFIEAITNFLTVGYPGP